MQLRKLFAQSIIWRAIYLLSVFLLNILIARYFKASGSGWIYYISNNLSFLLLLTSLSLESAIIFYGARKEIPFNKLSTLSFSWALGASVLLSLLLYLYYHNHPQKYTTLTLFIFSSSYIWGILLSTYYGALFYAMHNYRTPNLILAITNFVLLSFLPIAGWLHARAFIANTFLYYYFGIFLLQGFLLALAFNKKYTSNEPLQLPARNDLKKLFRYSSYALLTNTVFFIIYRADYWFIEKTCKICSEGDLGNYIQVSKIIQLFMVLPSMLSSAIFPRTVAGFREEIRNSLPVISRVIFVFYCIILLCIALIGKLLFPFIYGSTFDHMCLPFIISIPGILSLTLLSFLAAYNAGKDKISITLKGGIVSVIVIITGDLLFIPSYGIAAAATVSSMGYICYFIYILWRFTKEYKVPVYSFFLFKKSDFEYIRELFYKKNK